MTDSEIENLAKDLFQAERDNVQIPIATLAYGDMTLEEAYRVQDCLIAMKEAAGRKIIGWKIGLTSKAMQYALDMDQPDSGVLLDNMHFDTGAEIPKGRFIEPRIEAEIAFVMKKDLSGDDREAILDATDYIAPALEILDTRFVRRDAETGKTRQVLDSICDNAANAGIVLGRERAEPASRDMRRIGAIVCRNGEVEETGLGAGVLNDPVKSVSWLARRLDRYGRKIEKGQIVLSGSFVRPIECPSGSVICADFGDFGRVDASFA